MGIENLAALDHDDHRDLSAERQAKADAEAELAQREISKHDRKHREQAVEEKTARAEVEAKFVATREEIDAKYQSKLDRAERERQQSHSTNLKKREEALASVGLNPNGSNPYGRPQAVRDQDTGRVVNATTV